MSEQNILNPTAGSDLNPDYSYTEGLPNMMSQFQAKSGKVITRQLMARGRVYNLAWNNRAQTIADQLRQWEAQYREDFFSYFDQERQRYFSGRFAGPPQISPVGFNQWNIQAQFVEIPGLPMFAWPDGALWGRDSIFLGVLDGFGNKLVKLSGAWGANLANPAFKGNNGFFSAVTNDTAEWLYYGYGFRIWTIKEPSDGIAEIIINGLVAGTFDCYANTTQASSMLFDGAVVPLGLNRVQMRVTGTKNPASSGFVISADSVEVMQ